MEFEGPRIPGRYKVVSEHKIWAIKRISNPRIRGEDATVGYNTCLDENRFVVFVKIHVYPFAEKEKGWSMTVVMVTPIKMEDLLKCQNMPV